MLAHVAHGGRRLLVLVGCRRALWFRESPEAREGLARPIGQGRRRRRQGLFVIQGGAGSRAVERPGPKPAVQTDKTKEGEGVTCGP